MLKKPRSNIRETVKNLGKYFLLFELTLFATSYVIYRRMNRSQEFRHYMNNNFPSILDWYYSIGETISQSTLIREADLLAWEKNKTDSE